MWFAAAALAAFATAFVISLGLPRRGGAAGTPSALGPALPVARPLPPAGLRTVAPMPDLQRTGKRRITVHAAPTAPVATAAPTVTPTPTPTQEAIPETPAPAPRPAPRPEKTELPTVGQEFDLSG
jgi:outer membrane biosynthesis protein TonB